MVSSINQLQYLWKFLMKRSILHFGFIFISAYVICCIWSPDTYYFSPMCMWLIIVCPSGSDDQLSLLLLCYITGREYHVQFFGNEGERGWVNHRSLIPFDGREAFEKWAAEMRQKNRKTAKQYMVLPSRQKAWDIAMKEAATALPMSLQERKQTFTFHYVLPPQSTPSTSSPANSVPGTTKSPKRQTHNKRKLQDGTPSTSGPPRKKLKRLHSTSGSGWFQKSVSYCVLSYIIIRFCVYFLYMVSVCVASTWHPVWLSNMLITIISIVEVRQFLARDHFPHKVVHISLLLWLEHVRCMGWKETSLQAHN